jgi:hypothetical protein
MLEMRQRTLIVRKYAVIGPGRDKYLRFPVIVVLHTSLCFVFYSPFAGIRNETRLILRSFAPEIGDSLVKKFLRIALAVAVLASVASIALAAAPTGGVPQPQVDALLTSGTALTPWWKLLIAAFLSWLSH